jgi:hypothetical protein
MAVITTAGELRRKIAYYKKFRKDHTARYETKDAHFAERIETLSKELKETPEGIPFEAAK